MKRNERLYMLLTNVDDRLITESTPRVAQKIRRGIWIPWVSISACLVLLVGVMLIRDYEHSVTPSIDPIVPDNPQCGEPFEYPSLEKILSLQPMAELLPQVGYDLFENVKVYYTPDGVDDWPFYVNIYMHSGDDMYSRRSWGEISIWRLTEQELNNIGNYLRFADPDRPETYQYTDDWSVTFLGKLANTFYAEDMKEKNKALEIISNRSCCRLNDEWWGVDLYIVCNEYVLNYKFMSDEFVSDPENIYNIIVSSKYFESLLNNTNNAMEE